MIAKWGGRGFLLPSIHFCSFGTFTGFITTLLISKLVVPGGIARTSKFSNVPTATMIAGAIVAAEYFGGDVRDRVEQLYKRIDWNWFLDTKQQHFYMACHPEQVPEGKRG